ncbi:glycosyltransferase family 2 protein [Alphaproteobacteria bacterium KMM 3653]|uniref:Glycosyltransferase family 2 protein n=1 Tax=Harenicola maris TaxID=2841044 RepID=A0AAP2G412_9RHOB|nr:glycosyltransferase family 2 protein [Harenicola maris]
MAPDVSIVIPVKNERDNIGALVLAIAETCDPICGFEVLVVDDGSTDDTAAHVADMCRADPRIRLLQHPQSAGQSAAVHSGVIAAQAPIVCTLDGDGQNPASELPKLFAPLMTDEAGTLGLVAGQRVARQDTFSKRWASKFANGLRARMLNDGTRDTGCGLKGFRREAFLALPYFNHMHRYLPALFKRDGWEIALVDVAHAERGAGTSKYTNFGRAMVGVYDLIGVAWLIRRRKTAKASEPATTAQGAPRG